MNIYPGAAGTTVEATAVAAKLGVEDVAAAIADGTVTYVGLNADGTVYTAADGSTPAYTTNGPVGHWYNTECNPIVWGTPDPAGTGAVRLAYLEGDGATFTLGYDNSGNFVAGDAYKIAGKYINGDVEVIFEVAINVIEAPEADYVIDVNVVQDNGWGATYFALDGTDVTGWSAYDDADTYVNPVNGVSVDITAEIEAALGIEIGELENSINEGAVYVGAYNANYEFVDCYETVTSFQFFWFDKDGSIQGTNYACIDGFGFHEGLIQMYGTTCVQPNTAEIGTTYATYIVFKTEEAEYVVQINQEVVAAPEKVPAPEMEIVYTAEKTYEVVNPGAYTTPDPIFTIEDIMPDIQTLLEGEPDLMLMSSNVLEEEFVVWGPGGTPDGWFGIDGACGWGNGSVFCLKPNADGTFSYCAAYADGAGEASVTFRYCNTKSAKAADVKVNVILLAAE